MHSFCTYTAVSVCTTNDTRLSARNTPAYVYRLRVARFTSSSNAACDWNASECRERPDSTLARRYGGGS
ncbi:hypothetical protein KEM55_007157 [Ascosphaera atra]|nr:hypothetical protein KEM55_007157 [Ascosphaera atra]